MIRFARLSLVLFAAMASGTATFYGQSSSSATNQNDQRQQIPSQPLPRSSDPDEERAPDNQRTVTAPPREAGESSSRDQIVDLAPPTNDAKDHPDVTEFHQWDPHKAQKSVEVGDFYLKRKNYGAAIDRYREALQYKPNDAIATFHLAQALEQDQKFEDSRKEYTNYLKILPHGPSAPEARKALERLRKTAINQSSGKADQPKP